VTLRLVYRCYRGENLKGRPAFYSKHLCLASFLRAAEVADADVAFLNDGPLPPEMVELMRRRGEIVALAEGPIGMRGSYRAAIELPRTRRWSDDDLAYFCEDDYLHAPTAFTELSLAAEKIPTAHYFALYGSTPTHPALGPELPLTFPPGWKHRPNAEVDGHRWVNVPSTASTFGARVGTLLEDLGIFRQGMLPYRTRLLDHETCLVYQGQLPYTGAEIFVGPAATRFRSGLRAVAANAVLTPFRVAFELRALARRRDPHLLYAADPNLACHLETAFMSPGVDWADEARLASEWSAGMGWPIPARETG